ncbi:hypothetical protein TVAG_216380 [Trichomonas vaginalis G3]|uniref:Ubiquitin-like domain-containing protein n=1 Tax=Trichomonas vaginalis (strain ATCC PRA-98 / G3) TaxID=412133 RepID=A2ENX2_TRIV3|nr:ubiquitin-like family [Trichomonas vaginalis G3]EAY05662.1 hypothetical protein TVAG_216380 [Trichomonas vaginalis G3]KAI5553902.1 ubiquitin-like family [Trichomonas vaginalis G3]|eukprot:XP_001317885.1 hypothetical protein [Trichomonas vaginalis G3]
MVIDSHSEGDPIPSDGPITIRISGRAKLTTKISPFDAIESLDDLTENKGYRFVYNGAILLPTLSFSFYKIKENDIIYAVSPKVPETPIVAQERKIPDMTKQLREYFDRNWAHRVADPEEAFKRFQDTADPRVKYENARINDIIRDKQESSAAGFRKVCSRFEASINQDMPPSPSRNIQQPSRSPIPPNIRSRVGGDIVRFCDPL